MFAKRFKTFHSGWWTIKSHCLLALNKIAFLIDTIFEKLFPPTHWLLVFFNFNQSNCFCINELRLISLIDCPHLNYSWPDLLSFHFFFSTLTLSVIYFVLSFFCFFKILYLLFLYFLFRFSLSFFTFPLFILNLFLSFNLYISIFQLLISSLF